MPKRPPHRSIAEALADKANQYELRPHSKCDLCGMTLQTRTGASEHAAAHAAGLLPYGTITRYWIDVKQLPALIIIRKET